MIMMSTVSTQQFFFKWYNGKFKIKTAAEYESTKMP